MNKIFTGLALGVVTVAGSIFAGETLTRTDEGNLVRPAAERKGIPMPRGLEKRVHTESSLPSGLKSFSSSATSVPRHRTAKASAPKSVMKAASKASNIEGFCIYREGAADPGWYSVSWPNDKLKWKRPSQYSPTCGFVRGSELYAFYSLTETGYGIVDAGIAIHDVNTGETLEYIQIDIFDSVEQVALCAAYNSQDDEAYLITYNKAGTGYQLQKFDPVSKKFTPLGVTPPATFLDFAYNPSESAYFLLDESGKMMRYDSKGKKFTNVCSYSYDMTDYPNDMVYSPKDGAFFALLDSYDEDDYPCTDAVLLSLDGKVSYLGTINNNPQYSILSIQDTYVNSNAAKAPVLKSWNVDGAATSGSLTVTLPSQYENGKPLSGNVYLSVTMDGEALSGSFKGNAGADVTIPVSTTEGLHIFKLTPYTLTDDGRLNGSPLNVSRYFGLDTPAAPTNVVLTADKVTWNAVTAGANDGYINPSEVKYIVSIDGVRMNHEPVAATSLAVTIPATGAVAHRASVVAVASGKESAPGVSGKFYQDGPLSLPVNITVEEGEVDLDQDLINMFTVVNNPLNQDPSSLRGWRYDDQSERTGGFYCLCPSKSPTDKGDEWLFLPAINFPDKDAHYRFCVDLWSGNHYFTSDEYYEIGIAKRPSGNNATIIREEDIVYKGRYFELSETLFQVPEAGDYYIGIHYVSPLNAYRLYARNFRVEKAEASASSPAAVTDLTATAAPKGALQATLSFKMPLNSISGSALDAATVITVKGVSPAGEATVTGKPGEAVTLTVPTVQGDNIITVTPSSADGLGLSSEVLVYTGVYRPGKAIVDAVVSEDNQTMTLDIDLDDFNENDEYVDPDQCEITIYRKIGSDWRVAAEIGKNRKWTFECPDPTSQDLYHFGVAAKNAVGYCEEMTTFGVHLGKVFTLPMKETFPTQGENVNITYEPISLEHLSYLPAEWGFCDPADVDDAAANGGSTALYATWEATTQALLPRFSTAGMHNVKLDFNLFFGNKSPKLITVFASSPKVNMEPVASFTRTDGTGWEHKLISLPASCQNQGWVQIVIRVEIEGYAQFFLLDSYSIADYPEDMLTISSLKGNSRAALGDKLTYTAEIENAGTKAVSLPDYTFQILSDNGVAADLRALDAPESIEPKQKAVLNFEYTPKAADKGELLARLSISGQPAQAVSEAEVNTTLINALVPVVSDLEGIVNDGENVALSWSKPAYTDSFEAFEPWDYSEEMRGFRNLDLDQAKVWSIQELSYPGKGFAKAFQVFTGKGVDNPLLQANSGEYYLGCMSASKGASNDWLISPEVKGGSEVSFYMNICDGDYPETILVAYSTTGNNPDDFTDLPGGYICPDDRGWKKYSFTLPADAKYFALHHVGDNGDEQFGLMIDDLSFEPVEGAPAIEGYNLYRDGELIAAGLPTPGYVDNDADLSSPVMYTVKTLSTINGEKVESDRSNVVWTESSGVNNVTAFNGISAGKNRIFLIGFENGSRYTVANTGGAVIFSGEVSADRMNIPAAPGVYVVACGSAKAKVIVR